MKPSSSQFIIWSSPKPTLGFRILPSLGNECLNRKGYKMRCLQMPLFWFVSYANGIKRVRHKTFCFNIRLGPNHAHGTQHTYMGRGATPQSYVGFVCQNSHLCYLGNEQQYVHYPRVWSFFLFLQYLF